MSVSTRDKLVRDLTPREAGQLLVHSHVITRERRNALLFLRGPAQAYFSPEEQEQIKQWIQAEDYLPQDSTLAEHPKRPTHWCNYCGHVEACEHDQVKERRRTMKQDLEHAQGEIVRLKALVEELKQELAQSEKEGV